MLKPMTELEIESIARDAVSDAVDFVESEIAEDRIKAQSYFDGEVDIGEEEGRSKVVATKVRDTVRAIKPSLMRVFLSTDKPVEYVPRGPEDVSLAEQATEYMHYVFNEHNGYRVLNDCFHDAMVKKVGIAKVYWDTYEEQEVYDFQNVSEMEISIILQDDNIEIIEQEMVVEAQLDPMSGLEVEPASYNLKLAKTREEGKLCVESVPPEEFFVDRNARSIDNSYVVAHRTEMRVGDLVEMGYDFDEVYNLSGLTESGTMVDEEEHARRGYFKDRTEESHQDPSMKMVLVTEAYMKMDI